LSVLDAAPLALVDAAAASGFDYVGLRLVDPAPGGTLLPVVLDEALQRALQQRLNDTGVRVLDVETFWLWPTTQPADLRPALETASRLGARFLLVVGNDPDQSRLVAKFADLCQIARPFDLKAMLEFMPFSQTRT